jgi:chromosome segregation ATPase
MSNKFYKPKNEYGELLVGQPVLDKAVENLEKLIDLNESSRNEITSDLKKEDVRLDGRINELHKQLTKTVTDISDQVTNKAGELTADYNEKINEVQNILNNKPSFKFIKVEGSSSVENYIDGLWQNCKSVEEKEELKIQIGQTIYLLPDAEDKKNAYEEYICINLDKILTNYTQISGIIEFVRLGSFEDIVATNGRRGLVKLIHNVYDNDIQEWQNLLKEETIGGKSIGTHVPVEGLAVAPCALYEFRKADDDLRAEFKKDDDAIRLELQDVNTKVQQITNELNGVIEGNEDDFQNSRLDIIEKNITGLESEFDKIHGELGITTESGESRMERLERIIGIDGCESTCKEEHCDGTHNCNCNADNLDCSIICKIESIEEGLTSNSDTIATLSDDINNNIAQIETINGNISTLRAEIDDQKTIIFELESNLDEKINNSNGEQQAAVSDLNTKLDKLDTKLDEAVSVLDTKLESEIGSRPEGSDYGNISIWTKVQNLNDSCDSNNSEIEKLKAVVGDNNNLSSGSFEASLCSKTRYLLERINEVDTNAASIANVKTTADKNDALITSIKAEIGDRTDAAGDNTTIHAKLKKLSNDLSDVNDSLNSEIDNRISELSSSIDNDFATKCLVKGLIAENSAFITDNSTNIAELNTRLTSVEETLSDLDGCNTRIDFIETQIQENKNSIVGLEEDLGTITAELGTLGTPNSPADANSLLVWGRINANTNTLNEVKKSAEENGSKITGINSLIGERPEGATSIWNEFESINSKLNNINTAIDETTALVGTERDGTIGNPSLYGAYERLSEQVNINNTEANKQLDTLKKDITSLEASIDQKASSAELDSKSSIINEKLGKLEENIDGLEESIAQKASSTELLTLTNKVDEVKETAETAKSLIDNFTARKQSFGTVVLSAKIKPDDQSTPEDESILEISYQTICEAIKQRDGVEIMPKDLTIIFNGAMYDSMSGDPETSYHFYPDVKYIRKRTANDTDDSKLTLQFAGSDDISDILISLTYYSSATSAAYNIN